MDDIGLTEWGKNILVYVLPWPVCYLCWLIERKIGFQFFNLCSSRVPKLGLLILDGPRLWLCWSWQWSWQGAPGCPATSPSEKSSLQLCPLHESKSTKVWSGRECELVEIKCGIFKGLEWDKMSVWWLSRCPDSKTPPKDCTSWAVFQWIWWELWKPNRQESSLTLLH